ncbi:MAG: methionine biosynthesis protein MetW, partial [Candidatus Competibacteraceae bacterium]|nr:methionine biosynthesis protein MetW [Candidatus Competibacteraceae bacterium]
HGLMPVGKALPYQWYDTPNVHLFTIRDFEALCRHKRIDILQRMV